MAKLHFLLDGNPMGEFELDKERMTIGRRPSNQIHIDNLAVSGVHAVIVTIGNDSFLEDLNSTNGTMVNGKVIKKHVLQHQDVIEFGKYQLKYLNENHTSMAGDGFEKTMMILPKQEPVTAQKSAQSQTDEAETAANDEAHLTAESLPEAVEAEEAVEDVGPAAVESIGRLLVITGNNSGRELVLNKTMTTLGKPGSQVAVITKRPHGYFITHVGGNNHPVVNGLQIGVQAHALNDQDIIELAGTKMEFHLA
ncbi:MAG: FHA domain-containing protein [Pseudomonadota bacterium]